MRQAIAFVACLLVPPVAVQAADSVDYLRDIKPLFVHRCYACHGALKQESGLRLDTSSKIRLGGDSGPAIVAGKSADSLLVEKVTAESEENRMPPEGEPLSAEQIAVIKAWIDQGAKAPDEALPPDPRDHWAFRPPLRAAVPVAAGAVQPANPVDAFLDAEHRRHGLRPLPPAAKQVLLRRVYLDLIGLPPTREQLHAFLGDESPTAYEAVVDRLLASPQYGERWGRHWMDIWRYTDPFGLEDDYRYSQRHIWHWRDWILESLNEDKGYNRMIEEMLAADELAPEDLRTMRALGFVARNYYLYNRNVWLDNLVEHTGRGLLGLTLNCARCHDHKFDPISQKDYYRVRAFFEPHAVRTDRLPGEADLLKDGLPRVYDEKLDAQTFLFVRGAEEHPDKEHPLGPGVPAVLADVPLDISPVQLPLSAYYPDLRPFAEEQLIALADRAVNETNTALLAAQKNLAEARPRLESIQFRDPVPSSSESAGDAPLFADDFSRLRPELWKMSLGEWEYADGRLVQKQSTGPQCRLTSNENNPRDFSARLRFRITGGETRSVGLIFDADERGCHGVYVSPAASKVQIYHLVDGRKIYPDGASREVTVENGREYELKVAVRDRLVNVWLDGKLQLVYRLAQERRTGRLAITSYQAAVEFLSMSLASLPIRFPLAESLQTPPASAEQLRVDVTRQKLNVALAEKNLARLAAEAASMRARIAAENAKYSQPPDSKAGELAAIAATAERRAAVVTAEAGLLAAEQKLVTLKETIAADAQKADPQKTDSEKTDAEKSIALTANAEKQAANVAAAEKKLAQARARLARAQAALKHPGTRYAALGKVYPSKSSGRRLALARWIANRQNPLTARVAVNHIWARHFGEPIVGSMFDFGLRTKQLELQPLLDWLAVEFMESGWSMKRLHRLLVTSNAYRRSSGGAAGHPNSKIDPDNHYAWRMSIQRMEAEIIRDSLLFVSDNLDPAMGGHELPVDTADTSSRRTLYYRYARNDQMKFLSMFDSPSVDECYRRQSTIVPQQALVLVNSKMSLSAAVRLAAIISREIDGAEPAGSSRAFVTVAFERILSRLPSDAERLECEQALARLETMFRARNKAGESPQLKARETLVHVLVNHNDFVAIR